MPAPQFQPHDPVLVYVTAPNREVAGQLAQEAVGQRLAACVNLLGGMRSIYRWQGQIEEADEIAMLFKTSGRKVEALKHYIGTAHPYAMPCCIVLPPAGGLPGYLQWIAEQTL